MLNCAPSLPLSLSLSFFLFSSVRVRSSRQSGKDARRILSILSVEGKTQKTLEAIRIQQLATDTKIQRYTDTKIQLQPVFTEACNLWQLLLLLEGIDIYRQLMALIIAQCRSIMDF